MATPLERRIYSVGEARRLARRSLPRAVFDFVDGGAEDEATLRRNEAAFAAVELLPKPLSGSTARDQRLTLFGREIAMPLIVGPTGLSGLLWPDGELATARASAAAGIPYCLSHGSTCTIEALAECRCGAALDAGVHVPRPRPHPLVHGARAGCGLRGAGAHHRQSGPGQPRARHPQRLCDPAPAHGQDDAGHGGAARLAVADAEPA